MKGWHVIADDLGDTDGVTWLDRCVSDVEAFLRKRAAFQEWCRLHRLTEEP